MRNILLGFASAGVMLSAAGSAGAAVVTFSDRAMFESQGSIAFNSNFDDFGTSSVLPGTPFTRDGVTYTSDENLILGTGTGVVQNVLVNNLFTPLLGTIHSTHTMFGFDLGYVDDGSGSEQLIDLEITTNVSTYTYLGLTPPNAYDDLSFFGFITTDASEYFTGFQLSSPSGHDEYSIGPAVTNIAAGSVTLVPEPASIIVWCVFAASGISVGVRRRLRKSLG